MSDYLAPIINKGLSEISSLGLAHVGDAVFELMVRTWLCLNGTSTAKHLHKRTVELVSAKAQAAVVETIMPELSEDEVAIFKRGRNTQTNSTPKGCTLEEYHAATGLEALFGYLYLSGNTNRLNELFEIIKGE
jgi:ribonuclease-3 family protein